MDKDGYPTKAELAKIRAFGHRDVAGLISFLETIWWQSSWGFKLKGKKTLNLELHTGGWSGNEEIICNLKPTFFWMFFWRKSVRGGHHYFKVKL